MKTNQRIAAIITTLSLAAATPLLAANHSAKHVPESRAHAQTAAHTEVQRSTTKRLGHPARIMFRSRTIKTDCVHITRGSQGRESMLKRSGPPGKRLIGR